MQELSQAVQAAQAELGLSAGDFNATSYANFGASTWSIGFFLDGVLVGRATVTVD